MKAKLIAIGGFFLVALVACGGGSSSSSSSGSSDSGGPDTGSTTTYPAFRPSMPQLVKGGSIPVISAPVVVPVYFTGDSLQTALDADLSTWIASAQFTVLSQYGVTSGSIGTPIVLTETPAATLSATDIQTWIEGKLDGTHPEFGAVDAATLASKVFVVYYPGATSISWFGLSTNQYDAGVTFPSGAAANYVVVAESPPPMGVPLVDWTVAAAIGGIKDRVMSPDPSLKVFGSNWGNFDAAHAAFGLGLSGACDLDFSSFSSSAPGGTVLETGLLEPGVWDRVWSNKAATGYHDPCLPAPSGAYFVSVPVVSDQVQATFLKGIVNATGIVKTTTGVLVPVGTHKTVDVQLLSDGPTSSAWTVSTQLKGTSGFTFAFDRTTGQNGDVLRLTVTAPATAQQDLAAIYSTLDKRRTFWLFAVESK